MPEAKEYVTFAKSHGYEISEPVKVKRPQSVKKMYDINGKALKHMWQVTTGTRGVGKRGGKRVRHEDLRGEADKYWERASGVVEDDVGFKRDNPDYTIKQYALDLVDDNIEDAKLTGQTEWGRQLKQVKKYIEEREE